MKMAMESMEMDSGGTSPSRRRAGTETSVPRTWLRDGGGYVTFRGGRPIVLGFSETKEYIGEEVASGEPGGGLPTPGRSSGPSRAALWGAPPLAFSDSSSMFWNTPCKIGPWAFVSSNSENISCVGFLKPKTAENRNWRFGILLIG